MRHRYRKHCCYSTTADRQLHCFCHYPSPRMLLMCPLQQTQTRHQSPEQVLTHTSWPTLWTACSPTAHQKHTSDYVVVELLKQACHKQHNQITYILSHACRECGHCVVCQCLADCHHSWVSCARRSLQHARMQKCTQLIQALVIVFDVVCITMLRVALLMVGLSVHRRLTDRLIIILQSRAIEIGGCKAAPGSGHE